MTLYDPVFVLERYSRHWLYALVSGGALTVIVTPIIAPPL
jgi:hypothetical protein